MSWYDAVLGHTALLVFLASFLPPLRSLRVGARFSGKGYGANRRNPFCDSRLPFLRILSGQS
jgi:hypothetical protein